MDVGLGGPCLVRRSPPPSVLWPPSAHVVRGRSAVPVRGTATCGALNFVFCVLMIVFVRCKYR